MYKLRTVKLGQAVWVSLLVEALLLSGWMSDCRAAQSQGTKIDINELIHETQKMSQKVDEMALIWWIPEEHWQASFAQDPTMTKSQAEQFLKALRPYVLVAVIDGKMGPFAGVTYKSEADIRASLQLKDSQGTFYRPLSQDKIDADARNFLSIMKPILANMLGPLGQNMHFFVFPAKNSKGQKIADAKKQGFFSVKLGQNEFRWRLPLGSLLPPKMCTKCAEKCSGAWNFCPWCGSKLPQSAG